MTLHPVTKIAVRRLKNNLPRNLILVTTILFSAFMLAFFAAFQVLSIKAASDLPFEEFIGKLQKYIKTASETLLILTLAIIALHSLTRREENARTAAVLTSVGASSRDKRRLVLFEISVLYILPVFLGTCAGAAGGTLYAGNFARMVSSGYKSDPARLSLLIGAGFAVCISLILICNFPIKLKRAPLISRIREQRTKESLEPHGYRASQTFRRQSVLKRLAKKNVDFHRKEYRRISVSFAVSLLYPVVGFLIIFNILQQQVAVNIPYTGTDTTAAVMGIVDNLILTLLLCFLALTFLGFLQSTLMLRTHFLKRKSQIPIYKSVGISEKECGIIFRNEIVSCLTSTVIYALLAGTLIVWLFDLISRNEINAFTSTVIYILLAGTLTAWLFD